MFNLLKIIRKKHKSFVAGLNIPMFSGLEYEANVLRSNHSSSELISVHYIDRQHALAQWVL